MKRQKQPKQPLTLLERAKLVPYSWLCDPECEGRCFQCPAELVKELIEALEEKEK